MSHPLKVISMTSLEKSVTHWQELTESIKDLPHTYEEKSQVTSLEKQNLNKLIEGQDIVLVDQSLRIHLKDIVKHRSVRSHFLGYFDYLENREGKWWGFSLYSELFYQVLIKAIKNQDFKGSVIFLGLNPVLLPIVEVLTGFGFDDFVFLNVGEQQDELQTYFDKLKGFIGADLTIVDSTTFIQSQKEYSFCFVMESSYDQQTLDDMSYFHFLSSQSLVFDIVGSENFLFKEVRALGVEIVEFEHIQKQLVETYAVKIKDFARDLGDSPNL
ncbi:MAG: hypothetical protein HRT44_10400 [Bdellovibrionales bacterium]|nr:hypothetical protein [Bdellovibrionales bacterium]NQZ19650.1 hypothetical protein [Bdellovibrionales bacterium]